MWLELGALAVAALLGLWLAWRAEPRTAELARLLPGPPPWPLLGNLLSIPASPHAGLLKRAELIREYGHVIRIWLGSTLIVLLSDAKDAESILNNTVHIEKSTQYDYFHPWLGTGLLTSTGEKWHARRKAITPTFHFKMLEQFVEIFNRNGDVLIECLRKELSSRHFDVQPYISRYALDVICESAMGTELNAQLDSTSEYVEAVRRICGLLFKRMTRPWLWSASLFALSGGLAAQTQALRVLHGLTDKVIERKKRELYAGQISSDGAAPAEDKDSGVKKKTAFLELLLRLAGDSDGTFKTDDDIREEVDTFMFEGHDTTTSALCWTLHLLGKHRDVQERVYLELKETGVGDNPTYRSLQETKYLERVIKESLRLHPTIPIVARTLAEDLTIGSGYTLPRGCIVGVSQYFIHRNEEYFKNPLRFDPDNFLPEAVAGRHPYAYIPFSAGPRNCIGQKFAMLELKSALVKIVNSYKVEWVGEEWDPVANPALVLQSANGFRLRLSERAADTPSSPQ